MATLEFVIPESGIDRQKIIRDLMEDKPLSPEAQPVWNMVNDLRSKIEDEYQKKHTPQEQEAKTAKSWWQSTKELFSFKRTEQAKPINSIPVSEKGKNRWDWKTRFALGASSLAITALGAIGYDYSQKPLQETAVSNTASISQPETKYEVFVPMVEKPLIPTPKEVLPATPIPVETTKEEILVTIKPDDTIIHAMEGQNLEVTETSLTEVVLQNAQILEEFADSEQQIAINEVKDQKGGIRSVFKALHKIVPGQKFTLPSIFKKTTQS